MSNMFCFQCEQTVGGKGCTVAGACGKTADTSNLQDDLTLALIRFAIAAEGHAISDADAILMMEGLFTTITNVSFDDVSLNKLVAKVEAAGQAKRDANKVEVRAVISQGDQLFAGDPDIVSLRSLLLLGLRGMAAYAYHAMVLGKTDAEVNRGLFDGMRAVGNRPQRRRMAQPADEVRQGQLPLHGSCSMTPTPALTAIRSRPKSP